MRAAARRVGLLGRQLFLAGCRLAEPDGVDLVRPLALPAGRRGRVAGAMAS